MMLPPMPFIDVVTTGCEEAEYMATDRTRQGWDGDGSRQAVVAPTAARQASTGGGLKPEGRSCSGGMLKEWATVDGQRRETLHAGSSRRESFVEQAEASTPLPGPCFTLNSWWD